MSFLKKSVFLRAVWLIVTILWGIFILSNSLQTADESSEKSEQVLEVIEETVQKVEPDFELSHRLVRKSAHFFEYFVLGALFAVSVAVFKKTFINHSVTLFAGLLFALFDETLQLFSQGREGAVLDVWLDFSAVVFAHFICFLVKRCILNRVKRKSL